MNDSFKREFQDKWAKYFPGAELPVAYFYAADVSAQDREDSRDEEHCVVACFDRVRQGHTFVYSGDSPGCQGWKRYTGFSQTLRPNFEYFLSCGIPGEMEGERYKKSPELVQALPREPSRPSGRPGGSWSSSGGTSWRPGTGRSPSSSSRRPTCCPASSPWRTTTAPTRTA